MAVPLQIRKALDRMAKGIQTSKGTWTGTDFWALADAAGDEPYENRVKGQDLTDIDAILANGQIWGEGTLRKWFLDHVSYFVNDLSLAANQFDKYFEDVAGFRMPYEAAEALVSALGEGVRLGTHLVFPKGTLIIDADPTAGVMHKFGALTGTAGASTWASVDGALDSTKMIGSPIMCVSRDAAPGGPPTMRCYLQQTSLVPNYKDIVVTPDAAQWHNVVVGEQAITGAAGPADKVIEVAATAQFAVGEWVLLYEGADGDASLREVGQIHAIVLNTSIELEDYPVNSFTAAGFVRPMYGDIAWQSGNIANGTHLDFYALPDRIIAL